MVIDSGGGMLDVGYNGQLAEAAGGEYHSLEAPNAAEVASIVRTASERIDGQV